MTHLWLEPLPLSVVVATTLYVKRLYPTLPARVPTHFGFSGEPDSWSGKKKIWLLPGVSWGIFFLLGLPLLAHPPAQVGWTLVLEQLLTLGLFLQIIRLQVRLALGAPARVGITIWLLSALILVLPSVLALSRPHR